MPAKLIAVSAALGLLSSVAVALVVTPSENRAYPTAADFDWAFAQFPSASTFERASTSADHEKIRMAGFKRMVEQFRE